MEKQLPGSAPRALPGLRPATIQGATMKIAIMSDLHLEFDEEGMARSGGALSDQDASDFYRNPPQPEADVLVLAGDIHSGPRAIDWAARHFAVPTVVISGNHEAYGAELTATIAESRARAAGTAGRVVYLERATWTWISQAGEPVRFVGATLWTDFKLDGDSRRSMAIAREIVPDFQVIDIQSGKARRRLRPSDTVRLHHGSVDFLRRELRHPFDGLTVVVTHHAPSVGSIDPRFRDSPINPAFLSDLGDLIRASQPHLWIHGHMHDSFDYRIGRTRVVCNPRGYFPHELNPRFDPSLVVELTTEARTRPAA